MEGTILLKLDVPIQSVMRFTVTAMCTEDGLAEIRRSLDGLRKLTCDERHFSSYGRAITAELDESYRYVENGSYGFFQAVDRLLKVTSIVPVGELEPGNNMLDSSRMDGMRENVTHDAFRGYYCYVKILSSIDTKMLRN